jgi:peptidyl-prolyl cis-trans isomerase C
VSGCRQRQAVAPTPLATNVLAQVGDAVITRAQFETELARRSRVNPGRFDTAEEREALLEEMIQFEAAYAQAVAAGFTERPDIRERFRRLVVSRYEEEKAPRPEEIPAPSAADVESYYQSHKAHWTEPAKIRPAILYFKVSPKAAPENRRQAIARMDAVRGDAARLSEPHFGELARLHSEDHATRYQGGDCGWVQRDLKAYPWPREVVDAMFSLAPGQISPVIETREGLYLVKLMDRADATVKPLAEVRDQIAWKLRQQREADRKRQFAEQQRAGLRIEIHRAALRDIQAPATNLARQEATALPPQNP